MLCKTQSNSFFHNISLLNFSFKYNSHLQIYYLSSLYCFVPHHNLNKIKIISFENKAYIYGCILTVVCSFFLNYFIIIIIKLFVMDMDIFFLRMDVMFKNIQHWSFNILQTCKWPEKELNELKQIPNLLVYQNGRSLSMVNTFPESQMRSQTKIERLLYSSNYPRR